MVTLLAATDGPERGWGGPLAILIAFAVLGLVHLLRVRYGNLSSPAPAAPRVRRVKPQARPVSDTSDTVVDTYDWGAIERAARGPRWADAGEPLDDGEVDLALDEDEPETIDSWTENQLVAGVPYAEVVRSGMAQWQVSESTMKRTIRNVRRG